MEKELTHIVLDSNFEDCVVDYYPHIDMTIDDLTQIPMNEHNNYAIVGQIRNEIDFSINLPNCQYIDDKLTEYSYRDKKLVIHESNEREYLLIQQKYNKISDGLFVVSKIDCIDPNRFPMLNQYHTVSTKVIRKYEHKLISLYIIHEYNDTYIKLSFTLVNNDKYKKDIIKQFKEVISLLQHT